ncbi:MAG: T9SS type A sorting domain-containing protein [Bacteroidetes bacterium]|nr:T9SS type A sorting domain-containing protein [Bacteroidota bacterium]MBL7105899.1 T9SS type A sorting domain-containing protein [Bacteroidales bacterium]
MKHLNLLLLGLLFSFGIIAEEINYTDSWGKAGFTVESQNVSKVRINFSINSFGIINSLINGEAMQELFLPNVFLPNEEGAPNLPGTGRYIAIPQGAVASLTILDYRTEIIENINIAPAPRIPWETEDGPLEYTKDETIYNTDSFYPENPVILSEQTQIRGIDAVVLGITPFQYNPVTKQLIIYRDIQVEISFGGGNNHFGEDRLRSRWWDPLISDMFLNEASVPEMNYNKSFRGSKDTGCEYLIISPNNPEFQQWADSIKQFRTLQGIKTDVVTLDEIGGNLSYMIENYINTAYTTWDIPPVAILILGDYGTSAANNVIVPSWTGYCVSDNIYADVTGNNMPDIVIARITANDETELETMVTKFLDYERTPPANPDFYNHPVTALGWQTERWFQICSESVGGFWKNVLGKEPVRINAIYDGDPNVDPWSTAANTNTVLNVFGPNGLGYIPTSPAELGGWSGGNADKINDAINSGAFMMLHRDHGGEQGWGEPDYSSSDITGLSNTDLAFVFSINCLTGKYNLTNNSCFTEKFHRYTNGGQNSGAIGLIAASEVSYSFVNDTYVWGIYDNMWPEFLPQFGTTPDSRGVLPAFGNAGGKYFLQQSSWPYNTGNKTVTYHLFHHHGDAFLTVYTELPQDLTVIHDSNLLEGLETFTVLADTASLIALTVDGEIIGTAVGTGEPVQVIIQGQSSGSQMIVTVTKQNYYRYQATVDVIPSNVPYVIEESFEIDDNAGNNNGLMEYGESILLTVTMQNIGSVQANNVSVTLSTQNTDITITDGTENYGDFLPGSSVTIQDAFAFDVSYLIPDDVNVIFDVIASDGNDTWTSQLLIKSHAPVLEFTDFVLSDPNGNNNGRFDPGETVDITVTIANSGSSEAFNVIGEIVCADPYITINSAPQSYGNMAANTTSEQTFSVTSDAATPEGTLINFDFNISGDGGISGFGSFNTVVGKYTALVLDLDPKNYSGPGIYETFENMDIYAIYTTNFPEDLGIYKNIFVCLGLHFTNYELSQDEGQALKDFLLDGGNLYLEGRVTWKSDPQTPVHPMFNINVVDEMMFVYEEILGVSGTITNSMLFGYDGHNPVNNYSIVPEAPAMSIFTTQDPFYGCGVIYNAITYKTIGTTFEFGKLVDSISPSTKVELMQLFLDYFDGIITDVDENDPGYIKETGISGNYPNPFTNETTFSITLKGKSEVTLQIYTLQGKLVKTLIKNENLEKGRQNFIWDGRNDEGNKLPVGIYFSILQTGDVYDTQKVILIE